MQRARGTRDEVVRILHEEGPSLASELAAKIGVSEGAIRRHMDIMAGEGLVETELERHGRGRPATRYSLSVAGEERTAAQHYQKLLDRLYPALSRLPHEAVTGQDGLTILERVFDEIASEVAREYAPRVSGEVLGERVAQVTKALRDEGILEDVIDEGDMYRLRNVGCPYRSTAGETHVACAADRRIIELLVNAPVAQVATVADGAANCEYLVRKVEQIAREAGSAAGVAPVGSGKESKRS